MRARLDLFIGGYLPLSVVSGVPWRKLAMRSRRIFFVDRGIKMFPRLPLNQARQGYFFGDGDSFPSGSRKYMARLPRSHVHTYSPHKDFSDGEAAIRFARREARATEVALFLGMSEGRLDHHLSSLFYWLEIHPQGPWRRMVVIGPKAQLIFFRGRLHMRLPRKTPCAVFRNPLDRGPRGLDIRGVRYPLSGTPLKSASHGISNQISKGYIDIEGEGNQSYVLVLLTKVVAATGL